MNDSTAPLEIRDMGPASKLTRGFPYPVPYYENGAPPYDHFWPFPPN